MNAYLSHDKVYLLEAMSAGSPLHPGPGASQPSIYGNWYYWWYYSLPTSNCHAPEALT